MITIKDTKREGNLQITHFTVMDSSGITHDFVSTSVEMQTILQGGCSAFTTTTEIKK
jgi:hypothetical protein